MGENYIYFYIGNIVKIEGMDIEICFMCKYCRFYKIM